MHAEIGPIDALSTRHLDRWRALAARALEPNPFAEVDFVLPAARHLGETPSLLTVTEGDELRACVPVVRRQRWRKVPWPAVATWRHDYCFLGTPLVDGGHAPAALQALVGAAGPRVLVLEWVRSDGLVGRALSSTLGDAGRRPAIYEAFERPMARRSEGGLAMTTSRRRRKRLAELRARIGDELDGAVETVERAPDAGAVEQFLALEGAGWKGQAGTALRRRAGHAAFFREICGRFGSAGRLRIESLEVRGRPIAMVCSLVGGEGAFWFKTAYDERHARASPGVQLLMDLSVRLDRGGVVAWIDTCAAPPAAWLGGLVPGRTALHTIVIPPTGAVGQVIGAGTRGFVAARDRWHAHRGEEDA